MKYFIEIPLPRFAVEEEGGEGELEVLGMALEGQIDRQESSAGASLQKTPKIGWKNIWELFLCVFIIFSLDRPLRVLPAEGRNPDDPDHRF